MKKCFKIFIAMCCIVISFSVMSYADDSPHNLDERISLEVSWHNRNYFSFYILSPKAYTNY
jgi:hypothetical protein